MNPSYNSGSSASGVSDTPGVKPGVIASGPDSGDSTVEVPNVTPSGLSLGSNRGLFRRPQIVMPKRTMPPMGGGAGGVSGGSSQGPKKGLVIAGLAVVVILIVGALVAVMMGGGGGGSSRNGASSGTFNELINYVTSGKESTAEVDSQYSALNNYYFLDGWEDEEGKVAVYNKTKELMDDFVGSYKDGDNTDLNWLVKDLKAQFDFVYAINVKEELIGEDVIVKIQKDGGDAVKKYVSSYYGFLDTDNSYVNNFLEAYGNWVDALSEKINLYRENGCIENGELSDICMMQRYSEELNDTMSKISDAISNVYKKVNSYYNDGKSFVYALYNINTVFNSVVTENSDENN